MRMSTLVLKRNYILHFSFPIQKNVISPRQNNKHFKLLINEEKNVCYFKVAGQPKGGWDLTSNSNMADPFGEQHLLM